MPDSPTPSNAGGDNSKRPVLPDAERDERAKVLKAKRDTALAEAEAAEREAALAAQERDDAAARVRAAHAKAAAARAATAEGDPDANRDDLDAHPDAKVEDDAAPRHGAVESLYLAMLQHEAAALVHLHAQATNVQNIRNLVHVVLDLAAGNYNRWRDQILLVVGKYSLESHILADLSAPAFPDWVCMDCVVKSWIAGTISTDLAETAIDRNATARTVWRTLEDQFHGNREARVLQLDVKFRNFVQGDLSVTNYSRELKGMATNSPRSRGRCHRSHADPQSHPRAQQALLRRRSSAPPRHPLSPVQTPSTNCFWRR
jgi:hypothetical protein